MRAIASIAILILVIFSSSAANYLPNSSWEVGFARGWINYQTGETIDGDIFEPKSLITNDAHSGRYSAVVKGQYFSRAMYLPAGTYTSSMWCKCNSGSQGPLYFSIFADSDVSLGYIATNSFGIAGTWTRYAITNTFATNGFYHLTFYTGQPYVFLIDDLQVESGSGTSTYAPSDIIEMGLSSDNTNRMWFAGDTATFTLNFWNTGAATNSYGRYDVYNNWNSNVLGADFRIPLAAATNTSQTVNLPTKYGWYRIVSRLYSGNDSSDEIAVVHYPFSSNVVATATTNNWLGGHSHGSDYMATREVLANRYWHRDLSPNYINTRWGTTPGLEANRGDTYVFYDQYITNITYRGMEYLATLTTPDTGGWPTWATNTSSTTNSISPYIGSASFWDWSNYCYKVVAHHAPLGVRWFEIGPNEPLQSGPTGVGPVGPGEYDGATNLPINCRVSTNYAKLLTYGLHGATTAASNVGLYASCHFIAMAGANGNADWAQDVWTNLPPGITNWISAVSTHVYVQEDLTAESPTFPQDPNDKVEALGFSNNTLWWLNFFRPRGVPVWNTESGTYTFPSAFHGLNGQLIIDDDTEFLRRRERQERQITCSVYQLSQVLRDIGAGCDRYFNYDNRYWNQQVLGGVTPYSMDYTLVDYPHAFALSVAQYMVQHGFGQFTNTTTWYYMDLYACTNARGQAVIPIWASDKTNKTVMLDNSDFAVFDESGNMIQTNTAAVRVTRLPQYLVSGSRTLAQLSNSVRTATAVVAADTLAPRISIDIAPSGLWSGSGEALFKWIALDDTYTGWRITNTYTHTNVVYKYRVDSGAYSDYSVTNYVWWPSLSEGNHTFSVTASDKVGNTAEVVYYFVPPTSILNVSRNAGIGSVTFR